MPRELVGAWEDVDGLQLPEVVIRAFYPIALGTDPSLVDVLGDRKRVRTAVVFMDNCNSPVPTPRRRKPPTVKSPAAKASADSPAAPSTKRAKKVNCPSRSLSSLQDPADQLVQGIARRGGKAEKAGMGAAPTAVTQAASKPHCALSPPLITTHCALAAAHHNLNLHHERLIGGLREAAMAACCTTS